MATTAESGMPLGIPSERDTALADRAGRALDALIDGTEPVSARFGDQTVDLPRRRCGCSGRSSTGWHRARASP